MINLPIVRSSERRRYKRCPKAWYWAWRRGLVPRQKQFGALDLGAWVHAALEQWYQVGSKRHSGGLVKLFNSTANLYIRTAQSNNAPEHVIDKADELAALGEAMMIAYQDYYGQDEKLDIIGTEMPLDFSISNEEGLTIANHYFKPDAVFRFKGQSGVWLLETKTAATIRTEHLVIDDQARPYGAMAERALRKAKIIKPKEEFKGILYNFIRKALPDQRPTNSGGKYLNKDGSVSKKQPPPILVRKPITMTRRAKAITLRRTQAETIEITLKTLELRTGELQPHNIPKTSHWSCPTHCEFFAICAAEDEGVDIREMEQAMFIRRNPYEYEIASTDELPTFEMG